MARRLLSMALPARGEAISDACSIVRAKSSNTRKSSGDWMMLSAIDRVTRLTDVDVVNGALRGRVIAFQQFIRRDLKRDVIGQVRQGHVGVGPQGFQRPAAPFPRVRVGYVLAQHRDPAVGHVRM